MGKIIAVASGKGGTGKTTFTANTALALAAMGQRVLCLDCDITLRNLDLALGLSDSAVMDFSDVLEGRCTLAEAAVSHRKYPTLSLLAAPLAPVGARFSLNAMQTLAQTIRRQYDYCFIDAPAGLGQGFQLAAAVLEGQEAVYGQTGGVLHLLAGIGGGAQGMLGQNTAVSGAELDHQLFTVVVCDQGDIHIGYSLSCIVYHRARSRGARCPVMRLAMFS